MRPIKIGSVEISKNSPVVVIAEGCDNHNGSLAKAKEMAHAAKEAGAPIIKFQLHLPEEEMASREAMEQTSGEMFSKWGSLYGFVEQNLLKPEEHAELMAYCRKIGIQYFCTPFSLKAACLLDEMGAEGFKIGSGETEDLPMIEKIARIGKPMMISSGMSSVAEIDLAVDAVRSFGTPLCLAHCVSIYPIKRIEHLRLGAVSYLQKRYYVYVGFSDHTPPEGVVDENNNSISEEMIIWAAVAAGARFIEKHFTLDRNTPDADSSFSHDPKTLRRLVKSVQTCEEALSNKKNILKAELPVHIWAKRSVVAACDIAEDTEINFEMITSKRPGIGIRSKNYKQILGKKAVRTIKKGEIITWEDII
jgi:N-acetylneuraminate synthase